MVKKIAADGHEYDVSSTANATVAPTNDATLAKADKTVGLTSEEAEFVTILDYEWSLPERRVDKDYIGQEYGFTESEYDSFISRPLVVQALAERGILVQRITPEDSKDARTAKLTPIQLIVANVLLDLNDSRSDKKKIQDMGVTPYQYQGWLQDPNFKAYITQRAEALLGNAQHEASLALLDQVRSGNMKAIEYYNEMMGRFTRASSSNQGATNGQDLQTMVIRIIEIVIDETDPQTAMRISDRLKGLVTGAQVAGMLPAPEIVVPEIAQARELTPEVQSMMEKGLGYDS